MDKSCEVCLDEMEHEEHDFDCDHSCHGKRTMDKTTLQPAVIDGIRLERWINAPHEDGRFRLAGVLLPVRLMKDPLSTSILTEIENRVNSYDATQSALKALVEAVNKAHPLFTDYQLHRQEFFELDEAVHRAQEVGK